MRRWWLGLGAVATSVLLAGCPGGWGGGDPTTTSPGVPATAVATTSTTAVTGSGFEVPAVVDVAYAQRVLDELHRLEGELARHVYQSRALDAEFTERAEAIYGGEELRVALDLYQKDAALSFAGYANPPGDPIVAVLEVIDWGTGCMVVRADVDRRPLFTNPVTPGRGVVHHVVTARQSRFNTTGWGILIAGQPDQGEKLEVCA